MTFAQLEVLKSLKELHARRGASHYWLPRDLGAYRSSHHTHTLTRLETLGYVEKTVLAVGASGRAKYGYRISMSGLAAWTEFCAMAAIPAAQVIGGHADQGRILYAQRLLA